MSKKMWRGKWSNILSKDDATFINKIPEDKKHDFYDYFINSFSNLSRIDYEKKSEEYGISENILLRAGRFYINILTKIYVLTDEEIINSLEEVGINIDESKEILDYIKQNDDKIKKIKQHLKTDIIKTITDINWDINIKLASNDYIEKPEIVVTLMLETSERDEKLTVELNEDDLSWLEENILDIKEKYFEAKKILETLPT